MKFKFVLISLLHQLLWVTLTNSSQSDNIQVKSYILVKHHIFWYNLGFPNPPIGKQVKHLLIILLSILLLSSPVIGQSERPETIVIPVGTLGDISDSRKQIIQNTLSQELTKYFRLVPQDKFEEAQEKAFEELEYEECTEAESIFVIQDIQIIKRTFWYF